MAKVRLTVRVIEASEIAPGRAERCIWDADLRGFGIRLRGRAQAPPSRTYVIRYGRGRRGEGKTVPIGQHGGPWRPDPITGAARRLTLALARDEAIRLLGARVDGKDPADARRTFQAIPTLAGFWPIYEEDWVGLELAPHTRVKVRSAWKLHLKPWRGDTRLDHIDARAVTQLKKAMADFPIQFNRCRAYLGHMLKKARTWGYLPSGWAIATQDVPRYDEVERERGITVEELGRVGRALSAAEALYLKPRADQTDEEHERAVSPVAAAAMRTLMATGARPVEVLGIKLAELPGAIAAGAIVRPSRKVGRRRRKRRPVYLNPIANAVLLNAPTKPGNPFVFPGRLAGRHLTIFALDAAWERVRKAAGVEDIRLQDVSRHAFATIAATLGEPKLVQDLLGHSDFRTTQRYIHTAADPLRQLSDKTAAALDRALRGETAKTGDDPS